MTSHPEVVPNFVPNVLSLNHSFVWFRFLLDVLYHSSAGSSLHGIVELSFTTKHNVCKPTRFKGKHFPDAALQPALLAGKIYSPFWHWCRGEDVELQIQKSSCLPLALPQHKRLYPRYCAFFYVTYSYDGFAKIAETLDVQNVNHR